jgi:hypothetical protein
VTIVDPVMHEMGPGMLMYNGKVIFFGSANDKGRGKTVLYTPPALPTGTGTWVAGPDIPLVGNQTMVSNDCPAVLTPNGKVLFTAANFKINDWGSPVEFFEYDPASNTIAQAPTPVNNNIFPIPSAPGLYWSRMMLLPSGQALFSASSSNVQCYTPNGGPQEAWRPTISAVIPHGSVPDYYLLKGTQLNGLSQAVMYGDDCTNATNYPIVRLRNTLTGKVYFARTYDFSTLGVATGASLQSARFTLPNIPYGDYDLCVIANGISSHCVSFCHRKPCKPCCHETPKVDPCCCREDPCCCDDDRRSDPEVTGLRDQVARLQNSMSRLTSVVNGEEGVPQPKEKREAGDK